MRRWSLAIALGGVVFLAAPATPARAACVPASLSVLPVSGPTGSVFTVNGRGYYRNCSDLLSTPTPDRNIRLEFVSSSTTIPLATVDADINGSFERTAVVPASASPGQATVRAVGTSATQSATFLVTSASATTSSSAPRSTTSTTGRRTTSTVRTTTSTTEQPPDTLAPMPPPEIDPPTGGVSTDSTLAAGKSKNDDDDDWGSTAYIVLGIVVIGGAIAGVSARLYRHLGPPPL